MPHLEIAYFRRPLDDAQRQEFSKKLTQVVKDCLEVPESAISIALDPIDPKDWNEKIAGPRIAARKSALLRAPGYELPKT